MLDLPNPDVLCDVNDMSRRDVPRMATAVRDRSPPAVDDVAKRSKAALSSIEALDALDPGAEIGIAAGSRGIHDIPTVLRAIVDELDERGYTPFVFPAMGSHGGATPEGQREMLATLGITEETMGCEIKSSLEVVEVGTDANDRSVVAARDAMEADAVVLANRIKAHTDFTGSIESGLCKMAVIGVGKQRGANAAHNAALATSFRKVLPEWASIVLENTPIVGGIAVLENAHERAAHIEGIPAETILDREPALLERANELLPTLPVDSLDLLIIDEIGKNISGTGMDTNVVGRMLIHGEPEPDRPAITRIYVRDLTDEAHGNANGIGLADFAHEVAIERIELADMYLNCITGGQPERGRLPVIVPDDVTALTFAYSATGVTDPTDLRIARIENTLEADTLVVSEAVARELEANPEFTVGEPQQLTFNDGDFDAPVPWE